MSWEWIWLALQGAEKRGRILKEDIKAYAKAQLQKRAKPSAIKQAAYELPDLARFGDIERMDISKIDAVTSANMQRAWDQVPHAWVQKDMDITELDAGRKKQQGSSERFNHDRLIKQGFGTLSPKVSAI